MKSIKEVYQSGDWKAEKHVPVVDSPDTVKKGDAVKMTLSIGKEIPHPNTTEHHISWIEVYFHADGEKFPWQIGRYEFAAHGASVQGPNTSGVFAAPEVTVTFKTEKSGTIMASAYCNIHGLWESSKALTVK